MQHYFGPLSRRDLLRLASISLSGPALAGSSALAQDSASENGTDAAVVDTDVCVFGGTSAGVAAAIQARRMGKRAVLLEPGKHLGGMSASGLGATDTGKHETIGGIAREFYERVRHHYLSAYGPDSQQARDSRGGFRFEPLVAEQRFYEMAAEPDVPVTFQQRLKSVRKQGNRILEAVTENGTVIRAQMFVDASYEGDLMAKARVSYTVGRESNSKYDETLNGVYFGHPNHNFRVAVDPYVVEGSAASGVLPGISRAHPGEQGEGDRRVQAYCFRMCLTNVPGNRLPYPKPEGYDPDRYILLARYLRAGGWEGLHVDEKVPNGKTDTNNKGAFSTDNIGMNYGWPEGSYSVRERMLKEHVVYQQGLLWFLANDERVPERVRAEVGAWGPARDEFEETGGWPHQLYVREGRRMVSDVVMTEHHCRGKAKVSDGVALGSYAMDSHNCQRVARDGRVVNEGNVEAYNVVPYPVSYRAIVPRESECRNLVVPVCLSASHIAYGSIRMEPVFMNLGQAAATAACMAINGRSAVQKINVQRLQDQLREDGQILAYRPTA